MDKSGSPPQQGMGLIALFCLSVGAIIGVGWITLLGSWLHDAGALGAIIAFFLGGLIVLPVVFCYGEATSVVPEAGGEIAFVGAAGGQRAGFVVGWLLLLVFLGVVAFEAISVAWILGVLFPPLVGPVIYQVLGAEVHLGGLLIGIGGTLVIAGMHLRGLGSIEGLQNFATIAKLLVSMIFIGAGLIFGHPANLQPIFASPEPAKAWLGFLSVLSVTPLFYAGFNAMTQAVNERHPSVSLRAVGLVLVASILVSILFYCGVIAAAALSAPRAVLMASDLPAAAAFESAFHSIWMSRLVLVAGLLGLISAWNATFFAATRILATLAGQGTLAGWFGYRSPRTGSTVNAILFCAGFSLAGAILGKNALGPIVSTAAIALIGVFVMACWATLRLRKIMPDAPRSFAIPGGAPMGRLALALSTALLVVAVVQTVQGARGFPVELAVLAAWAVLGLLFGFRRGARPLAGETPR